MDRVNHPEIQPGSALGEYRIDAVLADGATFAARDGRGRRVVLKGVDDDCLLSGQRGQRGKGGQGGQGGALHPMIKDRLGRVRELAHMGVAQLYGVERLGDRPMLVWEHVEGKTLEEVLRAPIPHEQRIKLAHGLVAAVESLHTLGIVHGAIHGRNLIVTPRGDLKLTHISPLLWNEIDADTVAVTSVLESMELGESMPRNLGALSLREMAAGIRAHPMGPVLADSADENQKSASRARRMALVGAALVALIGALLAWGFFWYAQQWPGEGMATPPRSQRHAWIAAIEQPSFIARLAPALPNGKEGG